MSKKKLMGARCAAVTLAVMMPTAAVAQEFRSLDGTGNNQANPTWGSTDVALLRLTGADYGDGVSSPAGSTRPGARAISNAVCEQAGPRVNGAGVSSMVFQWGQFLDHDIDLTEAGDEAYHIPVAGDDPHFAPAPIIPLARSLHSHTTGTGLSNPRQQVNHITAFIDASQVYGSDEARATALRKNDGSGELATSRFDLLPFNVAGLPNAGGPDADLYLAGDVRANEQVALTAMHVLFVREHNRLAREIRKANRRLSGEQVYQRARALVGAQMQVITYNEFLPVIIGSDALPEYEGYDPAVNPGIANEFSTAAFRFGHSMLSSEIPRFKSNGKPIPEGNLGLREAFFTRTELNPNHGKGIEPILRGLSGQVAQDVDVYVVDDVRNFLFGAPGQGGFDLAALNIQRGRDHGLPAYNAVRAALDPGRGPAASYADISSDPIIQARLLEAYGQVDGEDNVDAVDLWVGGLAEDQAPGALVGPLFREIIADQFRRLRDGDRYWYARVFSGDTLAELESTTLKDIIVRNSKVKARDLGASAFIAE